NDNTVRLWDARTRKSLGVLAGHSSTIYGVAFSPDGRTLASASADKTIRLWNARTRRPLGVLAGHSSGVYGVAFSPDGRTLASSSNRRSATRAPSLAWRSAPTGAGSHPRMTTAPCGCRA
ncbi:MAG: WD40 repeat domain-containing protein, partial [Pyrinomonadaceae bacterium]